MAEDPDLSAKVDKLTDTVNRLSQNFDDYVFHQKEVKRVQVLERVVNLVKVYLVWLLSTYYTVEPLKNNVIDHYTHKPAFFMTVFYLAKVSRNLESGTRCVGICPV